MEVDLNRLFPDMDKRFELGARVQWTSSSTDKSGTIVEIVPAGQRPTMVKEAGDARPHESYVVSGMVVGRTGKPTNYWPVVSLLKPADELSAEEIEWCRANPAAIRSLMKGW
jgi:hypothetical protein